MQAAPAQTAPECGGEGDGVPAPRDPPQSEIPPSPASIPSIGFLWITKTDI